jgi:hypothetical protein
MDASNANLHSFVDALFQRYDANGNGTLTMSQLQSFTNDLFHLSGQGRNATNEEVLAAFKSLDSDQNGRIQKSELFNAFKWMTNTQYRPLQTSQPILSRGNNNYPHLAGSQAGTTQPANMGGQQMGNSCPLIRYGDPTWNMGYSGHK